MHIPGFLLAHHLEHSHGGLVRAGGEELGGIAAGRGRSAQRGSLAVEIAVADNQLLKLLLPHLE